MCYAHGNSSKFVRYRFGKMILKNHYKFKTAVFITLSVKQIYMLSRELNVLNNEIGFTTRPFLGLACFLLRISYK